MMNHYQTIKLEMNKNQYFLQLIFNEKYNNTFYIAAHYFVPFLMLSKIFQLLHHSSLIRNHHTFSHRSFSSICTTIFLFLIIAILNQNNNHHVASQAMPASPSKYDFITYTFSFCLQEMLLIH